MATREFTKKELWRQDVRQYGNPEAIKLSMFFTGIEAFRFCDNVLWFSSYSTLKRVENDKVTHEFSITYDQHQQFITDWLRQYANS